MVCLGAGEHQTRPAMSRGLGLGPTVLPFCGLRPQNTHLKLLIIVFLAAYNGIWQTAVVAGEWARHATPTAVSQDCAPVIRITGAGTPRGQPVANAGRVQRSRFRDEIGAASPTPVVGAYPWSGSQIIEDR